MEKLKNDGITSPKVSDRSGVADIYGYKAIFAGDTDSCKTKEVKKDIKILIEN